MKKTLLPFAVLPFAAFALAACNGGTSSSSAATSTPTETTQAAGTSTPAETSEAKTSQAAGTSTPAETTSEEIKKAVRPVKAFSYGDTTKSGTFDAFNAYRINLYEGGVYEYIQSHITYGYSMNLGSNVVVAYGTYDIGEEEDGVTPYTLNKAAEVVLTSYSNAGGFKIHVNTASSDQTYPTELPAKVQGEQNMAQSDEDVINQYGLGTKVYVGADNIFSYIDPNSEEDNPQPAVVETPSGSVESVVGNFKQVQIFSEISGQSMQSFAVDYLHIYEDDSYEYINTNITFGYSMVLGTSTIVNYGQGSYGTGEDGYTPYTLAKAEDVTLNSYSLAGGFSIAINTASADQTYPTELPAKTQGEQNMAQSKEDVLDQIGASFTVFTSDDNCVMSFVDPNAE